MVVHEHVRVVAHGSVLRPLYRELGHFELDGIDDDEVVIRPPLGCVRLTPIASRRRPSRNG